MNILSHIFKAFGILLLFTQLSFAQDIGDILKATQGMEIDKTQMANMIDILHKSGKITADQAKEAKEQLSGLDDAKLDEIKQQALFKMQNGMTDIPDMKNEESSSSTTSSGSLSTSLTSQKSKSSAGAVLLGSHKKSSSDSKLESLESKEKKEGVDLNSTLNYLNN